MTTESDNIIFLCDHNREINVKRSNKQYKHYSKLWSLFTISNLEKRMTLPTLS